ncbi:hypothetical protein OG866_00170 [Streptomyces sp. NBC_00663]|uniref:hypothetical protein n=1 Tax=Streptomyces sp. NBC_00663 TaxID=2975801 RepID=UPI002E31618E|nr:hypothetical protein [Streptomyces sp. NBC_00663]
MVAAAEQLAAVDSVVVMRRDGHALYRNQPTAPGRLARPAAGRVLIAEQFRPYTVEEAERFWAIQRRLHSVMPQYRDDLTAIGALACPLMPSALHPLRLVAPGPAVALPLPV